MYYNYIKNTLNNVKKNILVWKHFFKTIGHFMSLKSPGCPPWDTLRLQTKCPLQRTKWMTWSRKVIQVRHNKTYEYVCLLYPQPGHCTESVLLLDVLQSPAMGKARWFLEAMTARKSSQSPQVGLVGALAFLSVHTSHSVWGQRVWSPVAIHVISGGVKDAPDKLVECRIDKMSSLHAFSSPWCFILACFIQYMGYAYSSVHFNVKHVSLLNIIPHLF